MNENVGIRYKEPGSKGPWILMIIGIAIALLFGAMKVDASPLESTLWEERYEYYPGGTSGSMDYYKISTFSYSTDDYTKLHHFAYSTDSTGKKYSYVFYSFEPINFYGNLYECLYNADDSLKSVNYDGNFSYVDGKYNAQFILSDGTVVYIYAYGGIYMSADSDKVISETTICTNVYDLQVSNPDEALEMVLVNDLEPDVEYIPEIDLSDIDATGFYSEYIPTPKITVDDVGYSFGFNNAADNYYFELQGRWYSVDDIELFKKDLVWQYKYSTIIKSNLSSWVTAAEKMPAIDGYDFADLGAVAFESFLATYPIDNRTYYGGTNSIGNYFSGYSDAMNTLKMLLAVPESLYNGLEIYIRYFTIDDDGNVNYGKWCHWYDALADSSGSTGSELDDKENMHNESQSESGLTTEQKEALEDSGNSKTDTDVITEYINNSPDEIASQQIWNIMESLINAMGVFPSLISTVFGWLPGWLINMIAVSLASMIILRFLGR